MGGAALRIPFCNDFGSALMHLLAWKDGKVRKAADGSNKTLRPKDSYHVGNTKPNTLSGRHEKILKSKEFFLGQVTLERRARSKPS